MKKKTICGSMMLAVLAVAGPTFGQNLTDRYIALDPGLSAKGTFDGTNFRFVNSGIVRFEGFEAFCIEPLQGISLGEEITFDLSSEYGTPEISSAISKLVGGYYSSGLTDLEAAASQWAIWEVVLDGTTGSLFTGNAQLMDLEVAVLANEYISQLSTLPGTDVTFLTHSTRQDMVSANVPEPALLALAALSGLLVFHRRRG